MNTVIISGRLTKNPEVNTYTAEDKEIIVAKFSIAHNHNNDKVTFIDIVAFNKQAELVGEYLFKGTKILLNAELTLNAWEDDNGQKRSRHELVLNSFEFMESKPAEANDAETE